MTVFILRTDGTFLGIAHRDGTQALDNLADIFQIDGDEQPFIRILDNDLHLGIHVDQSHLAPALKEHRKVGLFLLELNHVGIHSRQEEDVVHQL